MTCVGSDNKATQTEVTNSSQGKNSSPSAFVNKSMSKASTRSNSILSKAKPVYKALAKTTASKTGKTASKTGKKVNTLAEQADIPQTKVAKGKVVTSNRMPTSSSCCTGNLIIKTSPTKISKKAPTTFLQILQATINQLNSSSPNNVTDQPELLNSPGYQLGPGSKTFQKLRNILEFKGIFWNYLYE